MLSGLFPIRVNELISSSIFSYVSITLPKVDGVSGGDPGGV